MVEVHVLEDGGEAIFHVLADAHLLFVDGFDLHELVLVLEAEQEGVVDEVEVGTLREVGAEGLYWVEGGS